MIIQLPSNQNISSMIRILLFLFVFTSFSFSLFSQKGSIISAGVANHSHSTDIFRLSDPNTLGSYITYEYIPSSHMTGGFRFNKSLTSSNVNYWDLRLFLGVLLQPPSSLGKPDSKSRFQFPIVFNISYFSLNDIQSDRYGYVGIGAQGGVRFYLTNKVALEGFYNYNRNFINRISTTNFNESIGHITTSQVGVGISYFLSK